MLGGKNYSVSAGTKTAAVLELQGLVQRFSAGTLEQRLTVEEWLAEWIRRGESTWRRATVDRYKEVAGKHLVPALGQVELAEISAREIAACVHDREKGAATRLKMYRMLHRAFVVAMRDGLLERNPCQQVEPPRAMPRKPEIWSTAEAAKFLSKLDMSRPESLLWVILMGTGCRLGEALALTWECYNDKDGTIAITQTLSEVRGVFSLGPTKTAAGARLVRLPRWATAALPSPRPTGQARILPPVHRSVVRKWFLRDCETAGVPPMRIHDLRHLHASLLLDAGIPAVAVAARLGHSSPAVTLAVYAHVISGQDRRSAEAIDRAFVRLG